MTNRIEQHLHHYRVSVGLWQLEVDGKSREDAICAARKELSRELPRLWDVIHNLAPDRFQVEDAQTNQGSTN
jgi:hypothetical protein